MKLKFLPFILVLLCITIRPGFSRQKIDYNLCDEDFSPLGMRQGLPKGAVYLDANASTDARVKDLIKRLTFEEKLALTGGWHAFYFPGLQRLGLRPIMFADAAQGVRIRPVDTCVKVKKTTAFPCELALGATWNKDLAFNYAKSIAEECKGNGISVLLGPTTNMYRHSEGGRNFETMGEDPFLSSNMLVAYTNGLQQNGTMATLKTLIGTEQELGRHVANSIIDERTMHELYLPNFELPIKKAGALAVMTGNNQVNGAPGAANKAVSQGILRDSWGYKGIIMSDWANSIYWSDRHSMLIPSGHSLLMSDNTLFAKYISAELKNSAGKKAEFESGLEKMVYYNLYPFFKFGYYDKPYKDPQLLNLLPSHKEIAKKTAEESITLLKNEGVLPISPSLNGKIVVLGSEEALNVYAGGGSGSVKGYDHVTYIDGLKKLYGDKLLTGDLKDDDIKSAAVVLFFIHKATSEGGDVPFDMPEINTQVDKYAALNKNIVVVFTGANGFAMPWLSKVKGLVFSYFGGQERGNAMANILSGKVSPSGKLPFTIEKDFNDSPAKDFNKLSDGNYYWGGGRKESLELGKKFGQVDVRYDEGVFMGYRWYEKKNILPQFPFGFGLSYTSFSITSSKASSSLIGNSLSSAISVKVTNTGKTAGAEVVQLYIKPENSGKVDRPVKELKGFEKVFLNPGETKEVKIPVTRQDFAYWSEKDHGWKVDPGKYAIEIGNSSGHISQKIDVSVK